MRTILPMAFRGSWSTTTKRSGTLYLARLATQWARTASSSSAVAPRPRRPPARRGARRARRARRRPPTPGRLEQHPLDLGRVDVGAAPDDHEALAVAEVEVAVVVEEADVAGVQLAAGQRLGRSRPGAPSSRASGGSGRRRARRRSRRSRPTASVAPSSAGDAHGEVRERPAAGPGHVRAVAGRRSTRPSAPRSGRRWRAPGRPNLASKADRIASGQSAPAGPHLVERRQVVRRDRVHRGQAVEQRRRAVPRGDRARSRIHSATPSASMRSITIEQPPACDTSSVVSTAMLRTVNGKQSPLRSVVVVAPASRRAPRPARAGCAGCARRPSGGRWCRSCRRARRARTGRRRRRPASSSAASTAARHSARSTTRTPRSGSVVVAEQQRRAGVLEQVALLGRRQRLVDADPHRAEAHGAVEGDHHVGVVRAATRPPGRRCARPARAGRGRPGSASRVELGVGQAAGPGDERLPARIVGQRPVEHARDRRRDGLHRREAYRD